MSEFDRPDPDNLLKAIQREQVSEKGGKLRIFFGMSAGVGKTYAMLRAAHAVLNDGADVVIGTVDTHGRKETEALLEGLPILPRKKMEYRGTVLEEMDLEAILLRKPAIVLVDELAHSNMPGSRHLKRYQDVLELLDSGIDVYTTLNVQHLESRKEAVEQISQIVIRETVPDSVLERASQIELIDISPTELLKRMREGKVYLGDRAEAAQKNFFKEGPLTALREIALRITAERVDQDLQDYTQASKTQGPWRANERLMVAVSHSPYSAKLIRATRRLAYNLEAPWIAVNIDTGLHLSDEDQAQLMKNLNLVKTLGGELMTTTDADVPTALDRIARQKNVTQIVVGRPSRRFLRDFIQGGSLLDRLVRESGEFDVHVVRQERPEIVRRSWLPHFRSDTKISDYWNVAWIMLMVSMFNGMLAPFIGYKAVGFFFLLAVLGISLFFPVGPVLLSATSSALIWDYFFIPPRLTIYISEKEDMLMCAMYFLSALVTGILTQRIRRHEKLLHDREARSTLLYEVVTDMVNTEKRSDFVASICLRLERLLGGECAILLKNPEGVLEVFDYHSHPFLHNEKEIAVATWAVQANKKAGWSTDTLSEAAALYTPLTGRGASIGALAFKPSSKKKVGVDREDLIAAVARQVAVSLEREMFEEKAHETEKLQESERLHQTLLASVSHELRTPLTALLGAATAALDQVSGVQKDKLTGMVNVAGERMNRVIENLLDMTRLSSGALNLQKEWHDLSDVVGVALRRLGPQGRDHDVVTDVNDGIGLIEIDFRLMEHVVSNLIFNSLIYSPKGTEVRVRAWAKKKKVFLSVEDEGPGVPDDALEKIFGKFYRAPGAPTGGTGLGLAIAKNIIELHGGTIHAENKMPGLRVIIELPQGNPPEVKI
jgi:two-component system sensor histidine kinase KdpD